MCILNKKNSKDNVYECHKIYALVTNARAKYTNVLDFIFGFDSCLFFFHESDRKAGANKTKCTTVFNVFETVTDVYTSKTDKNTRVFTQISSNDYICMDVQ